MTKASVIWISLMTTPYPLKQPEVADEEDVQDDSEWEQHLDALADA